MIISSECSREEHLGLENYPLELVNTVPCSFEAHGNIERLIKKNKAADIVSVTSQAVGAPIC